MHCWLNIWDRLNATLPTNFVLGNLVVIFHDAEYLLMFF